MSTTHLLTARTSRPPPALRRRLLQLFPRNYGSLRPWAQRLILNCITILTCLGVAVAVPGESGTVLTVTSATGGCRVGGLGWLAG